MSDVIKGPFPGRCGCPLVPRPTESFGDALVTFVSRSQFYELGKCVSYSSSFEHFSGDSSGRHPYTAAVSRDPSGGFFRLGCFSQGVELVLDGILPGNIVVGRVPSSVPGLKTTGSRKQREAAKQGSHT